MTEIIYIFSLADIVSTLTAFSLTISEVAHAIRGIFGGGGGLTVFGSFPAKDKRALKNWFKKLPEALKTIAGKAVEAFSTIIGSVFDSIFLF